MHEWRPLWVGHQSWGSDQAISHEYELASVTTLLDPLHLENLSVDPYVSEAQLACGDVIVISKTDAATPDTIARAEALARRINPGAALRAMSAMRTFTPPHCACMSA